MGLGKIPLFTIVWNIENKRGIEQDQTPSPPRKTIFFFLFSLLNAYSQKKSENELKKSYTQYGTDFPQNPT